MINIVNQEITIVGTYKDELKDDVKSIIRTKEETISKLNQVLEEDIGYSLVIAEYPIRKSFWKELWHNISFWRLHTILSDILLICILAFTYIYIVPLLEMI